MALVMAMEDKTRPCSSPPSSWQSCWPWPWVPWPLALSMPDASEDHPFHKCLDDSDCFLIDFRRKDILFASSSIPDRDPSPMPSPKITTARETSSTFTRPEPESKTLNQYKPTVEKKEEVKQDLNESKIEKRPAPPPPLMVSMTILKSRHLLKLCFLLQGDSDSADKPVLDRKISFNDNAEVIRVKPMEKTIDDISEAEEDDDDDDGGDSSDNEELTAM